MVDVVVYRWMCWYIVVEMVDVVVGVSGRESVQTGLSFSQLSITCYRKPPRQKTNGGSLKKNRNFNHEV